MFSRLQHNVRTLPIQSVISLAFADTGAIFMTHQAIIMSGMTFSSEFAIAFALSRLIRRFRIPVDLMTAGMISRAFPELCKIQIMDGLVPPSSSESKDEKAGKKKEEEEEEKKPGMFRRMINVVNNYGVAYVLAARLNGALTVFTLYHLLKTGTDANEFLSNFGITESMGEVAGTVSNITATFHIQFFT